MRSAFIIASFALTLLAAPIQVPKGQAPAVAEIVAPTEVALDARLDRGFHSGVLEEAYVEKRANHERYQFEEIEKRQGKKNLRSEEAEDEDEEVEVVEKRANYKSYQSEEIEKRQGKKNLRSEEAEDETEDDEDVEVVEKRSEGETGVAKGVNWIKPVARNVYNNMAGIIEALKTRGFNSANFVLPAREVV